VDEQDTLRLSAKLPGRARTGLAVCWCTALMLAVHARPCMQIGQVLVNYFR
jgi:hypothetical protein